MSTIIVNSIQPLSGTSLTVLGDVAANAYYGDGSNLTGIVAGAGVIPATYDELVDNITGQTLTPGAHYIITDFRTCYDQPDYDYNKNPITTGIYRDDTDVQPIVVFATSANTIATTAYQPAYPNDSIQYDWTFSATERTQGVAYGRISERIDEFNNRTDYDHRQIKFKRYRYYEYQLDSPFDGTVQVSFVSGSTMSVSGTGTNFLGAVVVGNRVGFDDSDYKVFEITDIVSDTEMTVTGLTNTNIGSGSKMYPTDWDEYSSYYQNNVQGSSQFEEYYTFDGSDNFNNYIGNHANLYDWEENNFLLANNVFHDRFTGNKFGDSCYNNTFFDDCENNNIGNFFYNNITDDDFDGNVIGNWFYNNRITANFQYNRIGENFYNNYLVQNSFYRNNVMNDFRDNEISGGDFQNNEIGSQFNNNVIRYGQFYKNDIGNGFNQNNVNSYFYGNLIGNGFNQNDIYCGFHDNTIGEYYEYNTIGDINNLNYAVFRENKIGTNFESNTITQDFYKNQIGTNFYSNDISGSTTNNVIGNTFENNTIYDDFTYNEISNEFKGNMMLDSFEENNIGLFVAGNQFSGGTYSNNFGNYTFDNDFLGNVSNNSWGNNFHNNNIDTNFNNNSIGNSFNFNTIGEDFYGNNIQNYFYENNIGDGFQTNEILHYFNNNTIGDNFGYGYSNPQGNKIGSNFYNNTVGEYFYNNSISDNFYQNEVGNYFQWNVISTNIDRTSFALNYGNLTGFSYTATGTGATNNFYSGIQICGTTQSIGVGATFDVNVSGGTVTGVSGNTQGRLYKVDDTLRILGTQIGGVTGVISGFSINNKLSVKVYKPADSTYQYPDNETEMDYLIDNSPLFDTYYSSNIQGVSYSTKTGIEQSDYGMVIEGYIQIPSGDTYYFGLSSDDGSDAFINGVKVADWYGAHGAFGPSGNAYPISLTAGTYPVKVRLQERSGQDVVTLFYGFDGVTWNNIPDSWFTLNTTGTTGSYLNINAQGGTGENSTFDVEVIDGLVDSVVLSNGGGSYQVGNVLTILGSAFGSTEDITITVDSVYSDDIIVTVTGVTSGSLFYDHYTKQIFERRLGDKRVSFYDEEDILNIDSVYEASGYIPVYSQPLTFPYTYTSFNFHCDGVYSNNGGTTNQTVNNAQQLVALFNGNFRSFGYFFDNNDGTIGLYINPSLKQQYCPNGTYTIFVFED